jgi:hypothetical protein
MTTIDSASRTDVVLTPSQPRPTPAPSRVSFSQVLAAGASAVAAGAQTALSKLPGSPVQAAAVRGGNSVESAPVVNMGGATVSASAEGPSPVSVGGVPISAGVGAGGISFGPSSNDPSGSIAASMQQMQDQNLYYLQVQQAVDAQNRMFTTLSNVLKTEHDSDKAAINNIHS